MNEENRQKMITAMEMMREACNANTSWDGCEKCPFNSFCTALQHHAIEVYDEPDYAPWCPMAWKPDEPDDDQTANK